MKRFICTLLWILFVFVGHSQIGVFKSVITDTVKAKDYRFQQLPNYSVYGGLTNITTSAYDLTTPPGNTATRPIVPSGKYILRYNTDSSALEIGNPSQVWKTLAQSSVQNFDTSSIQNFGLKVRSLFSATTPLLYNSVTGNLYILQSSSSQAGYLSSSDWIAFNTKLGDPGSNGFLVRTSPSTTASRQFIAASSNISIVNPTGLSGNPSIDLNDTLVLSQLTLPYIPATQQNADSVLYLNRTTGNLEVRSFIGGSASTCALNVTSGDDITTLLQFLINTGCKAIQIPKGTFTLSNTIQMKDSVTISGEGRATVLSITGNFPAFKCSYSQGGNKAQFRGLSFIGTWGTGTTKQEGIFADSANGIYITNISARRMAGWVIRIRNNGFCCGGYPTPTGVLGNMISDCWIDSCYGGIKHDTLGEFNSTINCTVVNGSYGFFTAGGSSRFSSCNGSGLDYGLVITGGANNAHGTIANSHFAHCWRQGLYVTGAANGYEIVGCNIRQDSITIENSDNIRFTSCEMGTESLNIKNSTNVIFLFPRMWGPPVYNITASTVTMVAADSVTNGISLIDLVHGKRFDLSHNNGVVNFAKTQVGKYSFDDTVEVSGNSVVTGAHSPGGNLKITSTSMTSKGRIFLGDKSGFDEGANWLGLGTQFPGAELDIVDSSDISTTMSITDRSYSVNAGPRILFLNNTGTVSQIFHGGSNNAFLPNGLFFDNTSSGGIKLCSRGGGPIVFGKSISQNTGEFFRIPTGTGNFLYNTMTDNASQGKFQIHASAVIDSLLRLKNMPAPPSAYNVMVHSTGVDSGVYQLPASSLSTPNFLNTNLVQAADRSHLSNGHNFTWDSVKNFSLTMRGTSFRGQRRYIQLFGNPQNSQELSDFAWLGSTIRKSDDTGDSTYQRLVFNHNSGIRLENINSTVTARSSLTLNVNSAEILGDALTLGTLPIVTTATDTLLIVKDWNETRRTNQVYKAAYSDIRGYKQYTALLTQSGTSDPTISVLGSNTIGSIVWVRTGTGTYTGTLSGAFTSAKTFFVIQAVDTNSGSLIGITRTDANTVTITCSNGGPSDNALNAASLEIRVYP